MRVLLLLCSVLTTALSQEFPSCEPRPEVYWALNVDMSGSKLAKLKWAEQQALQQRVLNDLINKYPRQITPYLELIRIARENQPERIPALQARYREQVLAHPDDAFALVIAAEALLDTATPESIRLGEAARAKAPQFFYPALFLAKAYSEGLRADKEKFAQNLRAYFAMCPASSDPAALRLLPKLADAALPAKVAAAIRTRLASETDSNRLMTYATLWALEFRGTPPSRHDSLRKQVSEDLKHLESLNAHPDDYYFQLLLSGYKQSGISQEALTAFEDRILRDAPHSVPAYSISRERWSKANKEPESQTDLPAWRAYDAKLIGQLLEWERQFPSATWLPGVRLDLILRQDGALTEKEGVKAIEAQLVHDREWQQPDPGTFLESASSLVDRKWRPDLALKLLVEAQAAFLVYEKQQEGSDNLTVDQLAQREKFVAYFRYVIPAYTLKAAALAHKPEAAELFRAQIEAPLPKNMERSPESRYWRNRALLASLDKRNADGLAYFQRALQRRPAEPQMYKGRIEDPLMDEAKELWTRMGGTGSAFAIWLAPPSGTEDQKPGRWEKPATGLPAFELSDLSGKTWRLKQLEGKIVMINLWATWCGPCNAELPQFQKLYEKVKDRADVQVISFNIDEQLGLVAPFMKEHNYTFPVLLAYDLTRSLLDGILIPQNWIVDGQGKWRWTQLGYGGEADWPGEMLKRLEATRLP